MSEDGGWDPAWDALIFPHLAEPEPEPPPLEPEPEPEPLPPPTLFLYDQGDDRDLLPVVYVLLFAIGLIGLGVLLLLSV